MATAGLRTTAIRLVDGVLHRTRVFAGLGRLARRGTSILMYHGLLRSPLPVPDACFVTAATFERQMAYLARHFHLVHVDEALDRQPSPTGRPYACVTFDDGFASIEKLAWPILRQHAVPATVYLVTGLVGSGRTVWSAMLHQAVCETRRSEVSFEGRVLDLAHTGPRAHASATLQSMLKKVPQARFAQALDDLLAALDAPAAEHFRPWEEFRILDAAAIARMSADPLLRFGAHTVSHQVLTRCPPGMARREIAASIEAVATMVEKPSRSFAYPNGGMDDFDANSVSALRQAGIACALTTVPGPMRCAGDPYAMPRCNISEVPMARFARSVHQVADIARGARAALGLS